MTTILWVSSAGIVLAVIVAVAIVLSVRSSRTSAPDGGGPRIELEQMTSDEATRMLEDALTVYAEQLAASSDLDLDTAMARGRDVQARVLPDGVATPGHAWWWLVTPDRERVGHVWLGPPEDGRPDLYVWAIEIDSATRGLGYGTGAIEAIITEADQLGLDGVYLNVFAANLGARRLYERHGFEVTGEDGGHVAMRRRSQQR